MRKGLMCIKKVVALLICIAMVINRKDLVVLASETEGMLQTDEIKYGIGIENKEEQIVGDTETKKQVINESYDVLFDNNDVNMDSVSDLTEDTKAGTIEEIKDFVENDNSILDNESELLNDSSSNIKENHICLGNHNSAAIDENGQLWMWGLNYYWKLGDRKTYCSSPKKVLENAKVKEVSLGVNHSGAIDENGRLWMWGKNKYGQLGDGTTTDCSTPKMILENVKVKEVSLGSDHSGAIDENGQLWMWGFNKYGQLGDGKKKDCSTPQKILENVKVKEVSLGKNYSAAIDENGQLWMWGDNGVGQLGDGTTTGCSTPQKIMKNEKVKEVSLGNKHSAAIDENGQLWMWGDNYYGELGDGITTERSTPKKVLENVKIKEVSLGSDHSGAIDENGQLWMWGNNSNGQLGDGTKKTHYAPKKVLENVKVKEVSLGFDHSAAIDENGQLWMWGDNYYGELGDGTTTNCLLPNKILGNEMKVKEVSLDFGRSAAIDEIGQLWMWGFFVDDDEPGDTKRSMPKKVLENVRVKEVSLGFHHSGAIDENGQLWMCEFNSYGELGDAKKVLESVRIKEVSLGSHHSGAIDENGQLWMWGDNYYGELGDGTTTDCSTPKKILENVKVKEVSLGVNHSGAIDENGQLWIWGYNGVGQLGDGTLTDSSLPKKVLQNVKIKEVSLGKDFSGAIDENGQLWMWGYNLYGQMGNGTATDRLDSRSPEKVLENVKVKEVSLGYGHSAAIDENGQLWMWGYNKYGQLGDGTTTDCSTPKMILENVKVKKVSLGDYHSGAIDNDGNLWMWGKNDDGELGYDVNPKIIMELGDANKESYSVFFNSNGGSSVPSVKVTPGGTVKKPTDPTKDNSTFAGWYKDEELTQPYDFNTPVTSSFTLYAKWTSKSEKDGITTTIDYATGSTQVKLNSGMFSEPSTKRNYDLMLLSAVLSAAAEGDGDGSDGKRICAAYDKLEMNSNYALYSYPKSERNRGQALRGNSVFADDNNLAFSIAHKKMTIDDSDVNVIFIVARGSKTNDEFYGDATTSIRYRQENYNNEVYDFPYDFAEDMVAGLQDYLSINPELKEGSVKFVITGHSLGGAAANLFTVRLINSNIGLNKNDLYCYTFGAIDSIKENVSTGYKNIHNIFNLWDTFGPYGPGISIAAVKLKAAGNSMYGKYGHMELFAYDYYEGATRTDEMDTRNHNMESYIDAVIHSNDWFPYTYGVKGFGLEDEYYKKIVSAHCPVDVSIYKDNTLIAKVVNNKIDQSNVQIPILIQDDEKYFALPEGEQYRVEITATDDGLFTYDVADISNGIIETKEFSDISLTKGKKFVSRIDDKTSLADTKLYVANESDEPIKEVQTDGNEVEIEPEPEPDIKDKNTIVSGQKINLKETYFSGVTETIDRFIVDNTKLAGVSKDFLSGKKPGVVKVTAQKKIGKNQYEPVGECTVTILNKPKLKFTKSMTYVGQTVNATDFFQTEDVKNLGATYWESAKPGIVEVTDAKAGTLKAKGPGSAKITAYFGEKGKAGTLKVSATIAVKVPAFQKNEYTMQTGGKLTLAMKNVNAVLNPSWVAEEESVIKVTPQMDKKGNKTGKVILEGLAYGDTKLIATIDGQEYECTVHVVKPVINKTTMDLKVGKTETLSLKNTKLKKQDIVWASEDPSIASVDSAGKITAKSVGSTVIYTEAGGVRNECMVTVK